MGGEGVLKLRCRAATNSVGTKKARETRIVHDCGQMCMAAIHATDLSSSQTWARPASWSDGVCKQPQNPLVHRTLPLMNNND